MGKQAISSSSMTAGGEDRLTGQWDNGVMAGLYAGGTDVPIPVLLDTGQHLGAAGVS